MQMLFLFSFQRCVLHTIYLFVNFHGNGSDAQTGDKILTAIGSARSGDKMFAYFASCFPPHKSVAQGNGRSFKSTKSMLTLALPWACLLSYCSQRRRGPLPLSIPPMPHIQHVKRDSLAALTYINPSYSLADPAERSLQEVVRIHHNLSCKSLNPQEMTHGDLCTLWFQTSHQSLSERAGGQCMRRVKRGERSLRVAASLLPPSHPISVIICRRRRRRESRRVRCAVRGLPFSTSTGSWHFSVPVPTNCQQIHGTFLAKVYLSSLPTQCERT